MKRLVHTIDAAESVSNLVDITPLTGVGKRKTGRPSTYTPAIGSHICSLMADGQDLTAICQLPGMPHRVTVFDWLCRYSDFSYQYARARELNADWWFSKAQELAMAADPLTANLVRVQVDTIKWRCAKLSRRYNDRHIQEISGPGGGPIELEQSARVDASHMDTESRAALRALLLTAKAAPAKT